MQPNAHHAIAFEGPLDGSLELARSYIHETLGLSLDGNPDVVHFAFDRFGVDDARALKERAGQAPLGECQVFLLSFESATREAQNALLKVLEEPTPGTYFVLCVPTREMLLATVQSRLTYGERTTGTDTEGRGAAFLAATIKDRLKITEKIAKNKDRSGAARLLHEIEAVLHSDPAGNVGALVEIMMASTYVRDRSSSLKQLLDHVAVSLPRQ